MDRNSELSSVSKPRVGAGRTEGVSIDFRQFSEFLPCGVALLGVSGAVLRCNQVFERFTGIGEQARILDGAFGRGARSLKEALEAFEALDGGREERVEFPVLRLRGANGDVRDVNQKWCVGRYSPDALLLTVEDFGEAKPLDGLTANLVKHHQGEDLRTDIELANVTGKEGSAGLREGYSLFLYLLEGYGNAVFMLDLKGRFLFANSAFAQVAGSVDARLQGQTLEQVVGAELEEVIRGQNLLVLTGDRTLTFDVSWPHPEGARAMSVSRGVYRNHRGEVVGLFGVLTDVTDRKKAEKRLEKSEGHFRALIENCADRLGLIAADGTIQYASPSTRRILGYEPYDLVGTNVFLWVHPDDLMVLKFHFGELMHLPGASVNGQYRILHKDGGWQWMEFTATNLLADESVRAIVINERDISERKQSEVEMMRFEAMVESSNDAIVGADLSGLVTSWNPAAERIFGYSGEEILGQSGGKLVPAELLKEYLQIRTEALKGKAAVDFETVRVGKDGKKIEVSLTISPIRGRSHKVEGFSEIMRDITERRRLEKEILGISDRERQRLGQDLHDDLCQHLVGISLVGNLLYEDLARLGMAQADDAKQVTELIRKAVDQARSLARGLAPLNLTDSGFMAGLEALVTHTERMFRTPCVFECEAPVLMKSASVAMHLYRITQEALHNAAKHSQASNIRVRLEAVEGAILVSVCDNGVGLPDPTTVEVRAGSGLGMHTMRYRARLIGATLEIKRNPHGGTTVQCRLANRRKG